VESILQRPNQSVSTVSEESDRAGRVLRGDVSPHVSRLSDAQSAAPALLEPRRRSEIACRVVNCLIAGPLLILTAPVLAIAALAIKVTSPGPIFYTQARVGLNRRRRRQLPGGRYDRRTHSLGGKIFRMWKLRTMRYDAERQTGVTWAVQQDPRATPIGRLLRKSRIDEIPQLLNVLKGDMNIVGPRPERPSLVAQLSLGIPDYSLRLMARPGITGWAQVNQAYDATLDDVKRKVQLDLEYLRRQGVREDLRIMLRTIPVILLRRNGW
jgi:lipopolysaccharide/colanic/teichoic acid biosynthesis glycosyltransferase